VDYCRGETLQGVHLVRTRHGTGRGCVGSQARRRRALRLGTNGGSLRISASRPVVAEQSELAELAIIDSRVEREKNNE